MSMDDSEPSVLTYTAFRNRQLLEAWRRRQSEYEAQHARELGIDPVDADEDDDEGEDTGSAPRFRV